MRKALLTLLTTTACITASHAQIGITAGMNLAKYSYSEVRFDVHRKSILAYNFGVFYKKELAGKLSLLPALNYSLKGARVYYDYPIGFTGPMKNVNKIRYLQFTLPAIITFPISDEIDFEIGGGLFAAYLLKASQKTVEFDDSYVISDFARGDFKKMDVGLHFTAGFRMDKKLGFHFSYDLGLANIQGVANSPAVKTRNFSINITWLFSKSE